MNPNPLDGPGNRRGNSPKRNWIRRSTPARSWFLLYRVLAVILLLGVANFWGCSSPNAFLKCASIEIVSSYPEIECDVAAFDPRPTLELIPNHSDESETGIWGIDPDQRVKLVLETGMGNCAVKSRALGRILQTLGIPYQIVWIMNTDEARSGVGHTIVRCPIRQGSAINVGIVDMLEGGIPRSDGRLLDLKDLQLHEPIRAFRVEALTMHDDASSEYYGTALKHSVIAISRGSDFNRYFDFLKLTYVNTGVPRLEKLVYTVGSTILGIYPMVLITSDEMARFDTWFRVEVAIARTMIWAVRVLTLMLIIDSSMFAVRVISAARDRARFQTAVH